MKRPSERQRLLLRLLRKEPFSTTRELAAYAGCSPRAAWLSLTRLRARRLVENSGSCWRIP